jgi:spore germination cell wall hydrolase CwlJ-like protein
MRSKPILLGAVVSILLSVVFVTSVANPTQEKILDVEYHQLTKDAKRQVDCLAENIYHEARSEPVSGQIAVAMVTLNRVVDGRFPEDICGVVKQKTKNSENGKTVCQFSWYCMPVRLNKNSEYYQEALKHALHVYANYEVLDDITGGSLYYHADYVRPGWNLLKTVVIGRHIFYKEGRK